MCARARDLYCLSSIINNTCSFVPERESLLYSLVVRLPGDYGGGIGALRRGHLRIARLRCCALPLEYPGCAAHVSGRQELVTSD